MTFDGSVTTVKILLICKVFRCRSYVQISTVYLCCPTFTGHLFKLRRNVSFSLPLLRYSLRYSFRFVYARDLSSFIIGQRSQFILESFRSEFTANL